MILKNDIGLKYHLVTQHSADQSITSVYPKKKKKKKNFCFLEIETPKKYNVEESFTNQTDLYTTIFFYHNY